MIPICAWALNYTESCPFLPLNSKMQRYLGLFPEDSFLLHRQDADGESWVRKMETSNKLLPVWCIEDPAHPKPTHSCEPSPPFLSPSWASQSVHILMVFIWSRLLSIKGWDKDLSLFPGAGLLRLCWIVPGRPSLSLGSLEPGVTPANLVSLCYNDCMGLRWPFITLDFVSFGGEGKRSSFV